MTGDLRCWHNYVSNDRYERRSAAEQINPDNNDEYLSSEKDRVLEKLETISHSELAKCLQFLTNAQQDVEDDDAYYFSAFHSAVERLQQIKNGRSADRIVTEIITNESYLDTILSIGDYAEERLPSQIPESVRHAVTFLRREVGFEAYHSQRKKYNRVIGIRERREEASAKLKEVLQK